ncbi:MULTISPECIES: acyltransferase family protein [Providencia]|uniref:acyltransferase family protein n=1 Tax=Providencia TaxID=586 RepID=UPI00187417FB|nr:MULTISPECIES: acyltransferase family protein [Providencia]
MRNVAVDNAKFFLIMLVVFGHLLETKISSSQVLTDIFKTIYSFHMPAFIMLSGLFFNTKNNVKKTYNNIIVPFIFYNLLYELILFTSAKTLSYYTLVLSPAWIMWFLYSLAIWRLITPIFLKIKYPFVISVFISLIACNFNFIGYPLGLSRTLTFFPVFLFSVLYKDVIFKSFNFKYKALSLIAFILLLSGVYFSDIDYRIWFGSRSMSTLGYGAISGTLLKLATLLISILLSILLFTLISRKNISTTNFGENTLHVYLAHGVIIKLLSFAGIFTLLFDKFGEVYFSIVMAVFAVVISITLSMRFIKNINEYIFKFIQLKQ